MKNNTYLSVVITCYNEEKNLERCVLRDVYEFLSKKEYKWEVIINDDGSSDKSVSLIKKQIKDWKQFKLLESNHGGKPAGLMHGIKAAKGKYILFTDVDQSTPIKELDKLIPKMKGDVAAVIGSRGLTREDFPIYRRLGAIVFASFRGMLILPEITDTQCGFKLFDASVLKKVFPKLEVFRSKKEAKGWTVTSYDVELLHMIKKRGLKIVEVEVEWNDKDESESKGSPGGKYFKESKEMVLQILRVKRNDIKGLYSK
jgi:dolichyl-phosphate beta-glucosyltransferase